MIVNTIKDCLYRVTSPGACIISAPADDGGTYRLACLPIGGQTIFQAPSNYAVISNDSAHVVLNNATAQPSLTAEQTQNMIEHAVYTPTPSSVRVIDGGQANASATSIILSPAHVPHGELTSITIKCRHNDSGGYAQEPAYLCLLESSDNTIFHPIGVSTHAATQVPAQDTTWYFERSIILHPSRYLKIVLLPTQTSTRYDSELLIGLRTSNAPDGDDSLISNGTTRLSALPVLTFGLDLFMPRFASVHHESDSSLHLSPAEKDSLYSPSAISSTPAGTTSADFNWTQLAAANIQPGKLAAISYRCRSSASEQMSTDPRFLAIWEADDSSANSFSLLGVSLNSQIQVSGESLHFLFDNLPLSGRIIRLVLIESRDSGWNANSVFGAEVSPSTDGSFLRSGSTTTNFIPELTITMLALDTGRKLLPDEQQLLTYLLQNKEALINLLSNQPQEQEPEQDQDQDNEND